MSSRDLWDRIKTFFQSSPVVEKDRNRAAERRLDEFLSEAGRDGLIEEEARDMFQAVIRLSSTTVLKIMVPRTDIAAVSDEVGIPEVIEVVLSSGHSRIPVFHETIDRVVGFVHAKDILKHWGKSPGDVKLSELLRNATFVPESKAIIELLKEFQEKKLQLAIVVDEYGGTSGIVSIEDIVEEIVGEIEDEYDPQEDAPAVVEKDGWLEAAANLPIVEFFEVYDADPPEGEFTSLGGWIFDRIGRIPKKGEALDVEGYRVRVLDADERRILRLAVAKDSRGESRSGA